MSPEKEDLLLPLNINNYMHPEHFIALLDWLILMQKRYQDSTFCLAAVKFENIDMLQAKHGDERTQNIIKKFAQKLIDNTRITDLTSHWEHDLIYLILPRTDAAGSQLLLDTLSCFQAQEKFKEDEQLKLKTSFICSNQEDLKNTSAKDLLKKTQSLLF